MAGSIFCLVIGLGFASGALLAKSTTTEFVCYAVALIFILGAAIGSDSEHPDPNEGDSYIP